MNCSLNRDGFGGELKRKKEVVLAPSGWCCVSCPFFCASCQVALCPRLLGSQLAGGTNLSVGPGELGLESWAWAG